MSQDFSKLGIPPPGYRLPPGTLPGVVRLQVADLDRSLAFYRDVLGFEVSGQTGHHGRGGDTERAADVVALGPRDDRAVLLELHEKPGARPVPRAGHLGLFHFAVLLPDREALGRFAAHAMRMNFPMGASDHRVSEALYLTDPDGLGVEVYADRPPSAWKRDGRQIVMATDPLDVAGLIRETQGRPWEGMPRGTRIGHLHLRVGDLDEADAFYHGALGLDRTVWSYPGALFLSAGGYHHHLGVNTWARGSSPPDEADARLLEWELLVPAVEDLDGVARSLDEAGAAVAREGEAVRVPDPWGTTLRIEAQDREGGA